MNIQKPISKQPIPLHAKRVFKGIVFDVYQWEQELYNGARTIFEKLKRQDTVVVFPVLPDGKILMTEQEHPGKKAFISACGGGVEEGEDVIEAARRELWEESGYEAGEFVLWKSLQPVSKIEWAVYVLVAKGLKKVSEPSPDGGEKIKLMPVTLEELIEMPLSANVNFSEQEIVEDLILAKYDPEKKKKLAELFKPN